MRVLVTHPGKIGDLLWALPTVRLIAEKYGEKVTLLVSIPLAKSGIGELLVLQPYIEDVVMDKWWEVQDTAPVSPRLPNWRQPEHLEYLKGFDRCINLGYHGWPKEQLARESYQIACVEGELSPLDLDRPWIEAPTQTQAGVVVQLGEFGEVSVGFTDEWGELKAGILLSLLGRYEYDFEVLAAKDGRWANEFYAGLSASEWVHAQSGGWVWTAYVLSHTQVFLGCLSSVAVLAKAMGKPRVLVEPNPHRHHPIFQHPDCPLVVGGDGLPTFDARHVGEALHAALRRVR